MDGWMESAKSTSLFLSLFLSLTLNTLCHFWMRILSGRVPVWAATSFFRSPMVSSSLEGMEGRRLRKRASESAAQVSLAPRFQLLHSLALDPDFLAQAVVEDDLNHCARRRACGDAGACVLDGRRARSTNRRVRAEAK